MTKPGASPSSSSSLENNVTTLEECISETLDMDSMVNALDASLSGPDEVTVIRSLRETAKMGVKEMNDDENHQSEVGMPSQEVTVSKGLNESRTELLQRVQALKKELENWRSKLDTQVKSYKEELGNLRCSLNTEVELLRDEFQELRNTLKLQRELTSTKLSKLDEPLELAFDPKAPLPAAKLAV
ncbi:uncharacterized protein [Physcomitrium patens]|uniref:Uncharacterized protein n=2 Tax=Physcomitrium patens TaxID=3218 RepID=A9S8V7_PHYPA|nr:uncharacterized protein LOC112277335 isoform X2 [Physcomitrium patens]XP_024365276.1 uncharacterized protein LOC112277335 isoform X2 [Physcomitrium patens]PNR27704.1 hypothetical protein PHYPA_029856 [Physcomitrium patens]|eukprot:XP_024365275.1 uncharacterized protein LOC112277335 isoform X2 [Physcomitrella patens]